MTSIAKTEIVATSDADPEWEPQLDAIAAKLRSLRFERGLRLVDLATMTGMSEVHLYRLETGERVPSVRSLLRLASAYRVAAGDLLSQRDDDLEPLQRHSGHAVWTGNEESGSGLMTHPGLSVRYDRESRRQPTSDLSAAQPTEGATVGSPETLIGMGLAGCFAMALAEQLSRAGFTPERIEAGADVRVNITAAQVAITEISLTCEAAVPTIDDDSFQTIAHLAERNCLVSRALAAIPKTLDARLVSVSPALPETAATLVARP
jgi:OsmC subfamily peroxiredoxin